MNLYPKLILEALEKVRYPGSGQDIVSLGMVGDDIHIEGRKVSFSIIFPKANDPFAKSVIKAAEAAIITYVDPEVEIKGNIQSQMPEVQKIEKPPLLPGVKNILAIASGKGGVGKSTVTANLAVALTKAGYRVGILDADIFGPSMPKMFDLEEARPSLIDVEGKDLIEPAEAYGIKILSIGFFVNTQDAVLWRGSMACNALNQLISEGYWGDLDYFLIDLPPGTSDIHLSLVQTLGITGAIIVTTPQQVALIDAVKGISMFLEDKVDVPVLGIVENMAWFTPKELPDNRYYIFGKDGGKELAEETGIPLLAEIPIVQGICDAGDAGSPIALEENSIIAQAFRNLALRVIEETEKRNRDLAPTKPVEVNFPSKNQQ